MTQVGEILLKGVVFLTVAALVLSAAIFFAGETERFSPEECPPYDQCTPTYHNPKCKCWDSK